MRFILRPLRRQVVLDHPWLAMAINLVVAAAILGLTYSVVEFGF